MKAEVRFYEKGFASAEVPEIKELREEVEVADREELVEAAKEVELPAAAYLPTPRQPMPVQRNEEQERLG